MSDKVATQNKAEVSASKRFTDAMVKEFNEGVGSVALSDFQQRLAQNYFMSIDDALKTAEIARSKKTGKWKDQVPVTWNNVDMPALARDLVTYARIGLDPAQKNHINAIPFKNNTTGKYDIVFIEGYRGIELKAEKYGLDVPDSVTVELVYSSDYFKAIKKDRNNKVESYDFEVTDPFDRGEIIGGFYYHIYNDNPSKNKLVIMTMKDIEKRKPKYASVEFWGGEKDVWKNGQKTGEKEVVEGWQEKMIYKTIHRAAYNDITIDSQKIDDNYTKLKALENRAVETRVNAEISEHANTEILDFEDEEIIDMEVVEDEPVEEPGVTIEDADGEQIVMEEPGY